jgi:hypothetical protein
MRNFNVENLPGGTYLVRLTPQCYKRLEEGKKPHIENTGFLSTIMYKVGYIHGHGHKTNDKEHQHIYCLVSMSDGWVSDGYIDDSKERGSEDRFVTHKGIQNFVDYLNNPNGQTQELRYASKEEVVRVVMYQSSRCKG